MLVLLAFNPGWETRRRKRIFLRIQKVRWEAFLKIVLFIIPVPTLRNMNWPVLLLWTILWQSRALPELTLLK